MLTVNQGGDWMLGIAWKPGKDLFCREVINNIVDPKRRLCRMTTIRALCCVEVILMRVVGGGKKVSWDAKRRWDKQYKQHKRAVAAGKGAN